MYDEVVILGEDFKFPVYKERVTASSVMPELLP